MPYLTQLAKVARRTGFPVVEVDGWKTRGHGPQPEVQGVVAHHTAGRNDMHIVRDGRPGLDGPLSQFWLKHDGTIYVVAAGRCWHNAPSTSAMHTNSASIGIEAENCLEAGTAILTARGLVPIEEVKRRDRVWTHRGRWQPVTAVIKRSARPAVRIRGTGHPGIVCSPDHPWFALSTFCGPGRGWELSRWRKQGHTTDWVEAGHMGGHMWLSPRTFGEMPIPHIDGLRVTPELMWVAGRWVADGSLEHHRVPVIAVRSEKAEEVRGRLHAAGYRWTETDRGSVISFRIPSAGLGRWLAKHFGETATQKTLPAWLLGAGDKFGSAFIDGCLHGDGWLKKSTTNGHGGTSQPRWEIATSSRCLAFGLVLLAQAAGMYGLVNTRRLQYDGEIEIAGRTTRQNTENWTVSLWPERPTRGGCYEVDEWIGRPVRSIEPAGDVVLYDLKVAEDHSFVADGMVSHNSGHEPWPVIQLDAYRRLCAELCREFNLPASRVRGHKEVNTQKQDPHSINMNDFRDDVAALLRGEPVEVDFEPATSWTEDIVKQLPVLEVGADSFDVKTLRGLLFARGGLAESAYGGSVGLRSWLELTLFDRALREDVLAFQRQKKLQADGICGPLTWRALARLS